MGTAMGRGALTDAEWRDEPRSISSGSRCRSLVLRCLSAAVPRRPRRRRSSSHGGGHEGGGRGANPCFPSACASIRVSSVSSVCLSLSVRSAALLVFAFACRAHAL
jgi:hypothetical protein